jgi:hypothetical protein
MSWGLVLRFVAVFLWLQFVGIALPDATSARPSGPGGPGIAPELRERLSRAAQDTLLAPWQRDFMMSLARGAQTSASDSGMAGGYLPLPESQLLATDSSWVELFIRARWFHSAIYDPVRDRMVVFGGYVGSYSYRNDVWALSLAGTPTWTALSPTGTPPSARGSHSAIYDPVRDCMVVFGGGDASGLRNDVWALSLAGTPAWTEVFPTGAPPSVRGDHSAVYDPVRDRMLVFGGAAHSYLNDVWALSLAGTPTWTALSPMGTPPSVRSTQSAIYDPVRDRMVVYGGYGAHTYRNDVWALSLAGTPAWTALVPIGTPPSGRCGHTANYDPLSDRMVVYGGYDDSSFRNDVWVLSLASTTAWTAMTPSGAAPSARMSHSAICDQLRGRLVLFGGYDGYPHNDVWALTLTDVPAWTALSTPPSARSAQSAIYDSVRERMVMFGGNGWSGYSNEVWTLSSAGPPTWTALAPSGTPPSARSYHSAIYDPVHERMVVFGGWDGSLFFNDVWALSLADTPVWTALTPVGTPPAAREGHTAVYDPVRDRMVVFGGWDGSSLRDDVWALSLAGTPVWTALAPSGSSPSARYLHSAIYDLVGDRMVVFGGWNGTTFCNDAWGLALAGAPAWTALCTLPSGLGGHSAIYDPVRDQMVVLGGSDASGFRNDLLALALTGTPAWSALTVAGTPPSARSCHSAIYDPVRDRMIVWGGKDAWTYFSDTWAVSLAGTVAGVGDHETCSSVALLRAPVPNPSHGAMTVSYSIAEAGRIQLGVYDLSGRLVRGLVDEERPAGAGTAIWSGADESGLRLGPGVYFVRLAGPGIHLTRKAVLLK